MLFREPLARLELDNFARLKRALVVVLVDLDDAESRIPTAKLSDLLGRNRGLWQLMHGGVGLVDRSFGLVRRGSSTMYVFNYITNVNIINNVCLINS